MAQHLILGASHALFMAQGLGRFEADWHAASQGAIRIEDTGCADTWDLLFLTPKTNFLSFRHGEHGVEVRADPALLRQLAQFNQAGSQVVCLVGGNEHNSRFLTAHPQPFDFMHPRGAAPKSGRQLVPRRMVQLALQEGMNVTLRTLHTLAGLLPLAQRVVVAPPPPIPSDDQIRRHPEIFDFDQSGIEDAEVRLKVYETMIDELTAQAEAMGFRLMSAPAENRDARGFLAEPYWHYSTHATPAYYAPVWSALGAVREPRPPTGVQDAVHDEFEAHASV